MSGRIVTGMVAPLFWLTHRTGTFARLTGDTRDAELDTCVKRTIRTTSGHGDASQLLMRPSG
jgi:hypothetical protein